jgi:hypothetical protein
MSYCITSGITYVIVLYDQIPLEFPYYYPSPLLGDSVSIYLAKSPRAQAICLDRPASISRNLSIAWARERVKEISIDNYMLPVL